ncbi:hypothetical protein D3P08_07845 [Paenibacillus nanensis]|uniref:DUF4190 domain-containing protein n=1 Tax=Paenibacillus nanensis TaxID=393251 RepID=A0A3A1V0T8_9BACL|nr:hypothetical protein [Paenibacillus nanensis]RIX54144.1 hypothetical protein D3P08_07845 [Paenibacillus nanensis]
MNEVKDNEIEYQRSSEKETERSFAPTNAGQPTQMVNVNEEMGADFAYGMPTTHVERLAARHDRDGEVEAGAKSAGYPLGWVSLIFAIASWFVWPVLLGATAAVLGYVAYRQGAKGLGGWAMAIGIVAVAINLVIVPFYYALT